MSSDINSIISASPPYLLAATASVCVVLAIIQAFRDKIKSGTLLGGLFLICVILAYFPQLDSIKAFAIDVKLRKSLDRAEEILDRVKALSIISGKSSYMAMAWNNRWGSPSAKDKQVLLDQVDRQLSQLNITDQERREISKPYVQMIGIDLYSAFEMVMEQYIEWKKNDLQKHLNTIEEQVTYKKFSDSVNTWRNAVYPGPIREFDSYDLQRYLDI